LIKNTDKRVTDMEYIAISTEPRPVALFATITNHESYSREKARQLYPWADEITVVKMKQFANAWNNRAEVVK